MRRSAGILMFKVTRARTPPAPGASRRTVVGEEGRGSMVDSQGEIDADEDPLAAARREFEEELGSRVSGEPRLGDP